MNFPKMALNKVYKNKILLIKLSQIKNKLKK